MLRITGVPSVLMFENVRLQSRIFFNLQKGKLKGRLVEEQLFSPENLEMLLSEC